MSESRGQVMLEELQQEANNLNAVLRPLLEELKNHTKGESAIATLQRLVSERRFWKREASNLRTELMACGHPKAMLTGLPDFPGDSSACTVSCDGCVIVYDTKAEVASRLRSIRRSSAVFGHGDNRPVTQIEDLEAWLKDLFGPGSVPPPPKEEGREW